MFIPSSKSKISLIVLFIVSLLLFVWVDRSRMYVKEDNFEKKMQAAKQMELAEKAIKEYRIEKGVFIDDLNDPNETALIGERESLIITDRGNLTAKLTSLNPNMAAVIVDMFMDAGLKKGDKVAVSCTGSFPGMNIAVFSAAKVLGLDLKIISSVGASMFGATAIDFTWLDMERFLYEKGIFSYRSSAASIGGGRDLGRGLTRKGRELIIESINRNNMPFVHEKSLEKNIERKMVIFDELASGDDYKLYINIGGGLSSLGTSLNGKLITAGLHRYLKLKNIPTKGTMFLFAERGIQILHILDIVKISERYDLHIAPEPLPKAGMGKVFESERYNITIASIALFLMIVVILVILFFDHRELKIRKDEINI